MATSGNGQAADAVLLRRLRRGDARALDALVGRYGPSVQAYLERCVGDAAAAEDLAHDVLVRVLGSRATCRDGTSLAVWLFRIARNLALDHARALAVRRRALADLRRAASRSRAPDLAAPERRELGARLDAAIRCLPEEFRAVFLLREMEGMSYEDIGRVVGVPAKTVSTRLHRARLRLRRLLADDGAAEGRRIRPREGTRP